jgi:hypothetical protein
MAKTIIGLILYSLPFGLLAQDSVSSSTGSHWSFSASGYYYFIPEENNIYTLIGGADYKKLHLETRYNYEALNTASVFAGWRFESGKKFQFAATPMLGFAVGNTNGFVPALELEARYKRFDFYSESEYLIDYAGQENNFFYVWSELAISPFDKLRTGLSVQRTKLYHTSFDTQRGIFGEYSIWKLTVGMYYFNPFTSANFVVASLSADF